MLNEQITLTRASLNGDDLEPKDRAQLIRGLCGLLDQLRIAKGEPLPGSRRVSSRTRRSARGRAIYASTRPTCASACPSASQADGLGV
jgi:hypothetical protein